MPTSRWRRSPPTPWLGCSPDGGLVLRRRRGTPGGRRCGRLCPGARPAGPSARIRSPVSAHAASTPTGQARLSYRTAAALFGRHSRGWTLHQLPHSSLTHLAEGGASAVMLQAKSRHRDLRTLSLYTRPGPEDVVRLTDDQFDRP